MWSQTTLDFNLSVRWLNKDWIDNGKLTSGDYPALWLRLERR